MALIKCPECGSGISDKSDVCIHCGYPIKQLGINNNTIDNQFVYDENMECPICHVTHKWVERREAGTIICPVCGYCYEVDKKQAEAYRKTGAQTQQKSQPNQPHCPVCNSSNLHKIGTGERMASVIGLGILSKKINKSFKCLNCEYTW